MNMNEQKVLILTLCNENKEWSNPPSGLSSMLLADAMGMAFSWV